MFLYCYFSLFFIYFISISLYNNVTFMLFSRLFLCLLSQCCPFWPASDSHKMYVKYLESSVSSQPFPVNVTHTTVLRMDKGVSPLHLSRVDEQPQYDSWLDRKYLNFFKSFSLRRKTFWWVTVCLGCWSWVERSINLKMVGFYNSIEIYTIYMK